MATLISALSYLALVLLLAGAQFWRGRPWPGLGLAGPLAGFLFLPNGSLPPFLDFTWSGPAYWLGLALGLLGRTARDRDPETWLQLLVLVLAWLFLCFYALKRGLPGDLPGLSVFAATPLLTQAGPKAGPGLVCLFLALGPLAARRDADSPAPLLTRFSISAFLISVFFPFGLSGLIGASGFLGPGLDFFLFWGKVLILNRIIAPRLAKAGRRAAMAWAAVGIPLLAADFFGY
ncbi:MAG: hypothetical protein LBC90_00090 [Candidatus Adiutrix sp.]|jgi:hypothetical protein|nr:hypothetical protein [Candidatus Adiutrix sp.]